MKYISKLLILSTLFLGSCDILDKDIDTNLDKDDIFTDERFAQGFLNSTYRELINGFNRLNTPCSPVLQTKRSVLIPAPRYTATTMEPSLLL